MLRVLILGGTGDAGELAARVANIPGIDAIASLAGRTLAPSPPVGNYRVGGFGGVTGLVNYLRDTQIDVLIDATHPFANQMSFHAADAATQVGIPRLLLNRPVWNQVKGDFWIEVENVTAAAAVLQQQAQRVFLTVGRQELSAFADLDHIFFLMRMIDPPTPDAVVPGGILLCDRGDF